MSTFAQAALFLLQAIGGFYLFILLLRLLLPLVRADFYNPLSQFVVKATNIPLTALHKVIPMAGRFDIACLLYAIAIQLGIFVAVLALKGLVGATLFQLLIVSLIGLADRVLDIYFFGILIVIIASWVAPYSSNPALVLVRQLIEPAMAPLRKILPSMGGLDLSPMIAILAIYVLRIFLGGIQQWLVGG